MTASVTKVNTVKRLISALLVLLLLAGMIIPVLGSVGEDAYVNDNEVYARTGPGTSYTPVTFANGESILLYWGQYVRILSGHVGADGRSWYQIVFTFRGYTKVGYMRSDFITKIGDDRDYQNYLDEQGFPKSYQPYLRALYAASGGKWTFLANKTGLDWDTSVTKESRLGVSLIHENYGTAVRSTASEVYDETTGTWTPMEGKHWYAANSETVAYYLDPRSYLTCGDCFAFQLPTCNNSITLNHVKSTLSDCVWATDQICQEFFQAGQEANVDPIYLAVKARNEIGRGTTKNATGYNYNGTTVYNFFNVGAYSSAPDPNYAGMVYAYEHGWTSSYAAILGGAEFIYSNYIMAGQSTQYLQRFNLTSEYTYAYQYATDITYAINGGWGTFNSYRSNGLLSANLTFSVPILENMPAVTKRPTGGYEYEYIPDPVEPDKPDTQYDYVAQLGYNLQDSYLSGFTLGTPVQDIVSRIRSINGGATVSVTDKNDELVSGNTPVGTGYKIVIQDQFSTLSYTCVVYGDVNGDGQIGATDMLLVKRHILGKSTLSGASARAATLANGQIGATSMLKIKRHILSLAMIAQK